MDTLFQEAVGVNFQQAITLPKATAAAECCSFSDTEGLVKAAGQRLSDMIGSGRSKGRRSRSRKAVRLQRYPTHPGYIITDPHIPNFTTAKGTKAEKDPQREARFIILLT